MKKFYIAAVICTLMAVARINADTRQGPLGTDGAHLDTWDYGGVDYSTVSVSSANVLAFSGSGIVVGYAASSNTNSTDFLTFFDSGTLSRPELASGNSDYVNPGSEFLRVYLPTQTIVSPANASFTTGNIVKLPAPIRVIKGLVFKSSVATINTITVLYHKFGTIGK